MISIFKNVAKAVVAVAATPATLVVDVLTLPSSAYNGRGPFDHTARRLSQAGKALDAAITPEGSAQ